MSMSYSRKNPNRGIGGWGVEKIIFCKRPRQFLNFSLFYPWWKFLPDKMKLHPWKFNKIVLHPSEFPRSSHQRCSVKKGVLKNFTNFTGKHLLPVLESPTQMFSCEIWEIFKNTYFKEYLWTTASVLCK